MSHNSKSYRKKLTKQTAFSCKKIDVLLRQHALASSGSQIDREDASKQDSERKSSEIASEPVSVSPTEDSTDPQAAIEVEAVSMVISESESEPEDEPAVIVPDNRRFVSAKYETQYKWLYFSAAKSGYCCKYCECLFRDNSTRHAYVGRAVNLGTHPTRKLEEHEKSENHKKAANKYLMPMSHSQGIPIAEQLRQQASTSDANKQETAKNYMRVLFKSAFYIAKQNWAVGENLDCFMKNFLGQSLQVKEVQQYLAVNPQITYTSPSSIQEILESLSFVFENDILVKIRQAPCYALMADESTDEANRNQFAILGKFLLDGKISDVFLGLVRVTRATAENLMAAIEGFLIAKGVPILKAILVGFDGCNTMSGEQNGLQRRFRHLVPHQLYVHCRNHRLALCIKHLVKEYPVLGELDELLMSIWKLFNYSPQKFAVFEQVQNAYGLQKLTMIKAVSTRWLSHGRATSRMLDRFGAVLDTLDQLYETRREPEICGLRQMLTNKNVIAAATVLCDMLVPVSQLSDYLQGDVHFVRVNEKVKELVDKLTDMAHRFRLVGQGQADMALQFSKVEGLWAEIDDRTDLARRLRAPPQMSVHQFAEEFASPIVYSLIGEITDAFNCSPVLQAFSVFNLKDIPESVADMVNYGQEKGYP